MLSPVNDSFETVQSGSREGNPPRNRWVYGNDELRIATMSQDEEQKHIHGMSTWPIVTKLTDSAFLPPNCATRRKTAFSSECTLYENVGAITPFDDSMPQPKIFIRKRTLMLSETSGMPAETSFHRDDEAPLSVRTITCTGSSLTILSTHYCLYSRRGRVCISYTVGSD